MMGFKKKDVIEHPNYGHGVITKMRAVHDALTILDVDFKKEGIINSLMQHGLRIIVSILNISQRQNPNSKMVSIPKMYLCPQGNGMFFLKKIPLWVLL